MSETPTLTRGQLISTFASYGARPADLRVGGEFERALVKNSGQAMAYDEPSGIRWVLEQLHTHQSGWSPVFEGDNLIALTRPDGSNITLEPGGQVELSGAPYADLRDLADELNENRSFLIDLVADQPLRWIAAGLTPLADINDIPWMPKGRYEVMRSYLPSRGDLALFMMKGTCSVQANYDFTDEADCARKVRLASSMAPITTAIFANSPLYRGKPTGYQSYRGHIWTRTDPDRTGFPPGLRADYSHERWVDYLLDVPMMFYKKSGHWAAANGRSFRDFMESGFDGQFPTLEDWALHQTSVFPEVRVKQTIEVRGADCVDADRAIGLCALFTGLMYDAVALDEALVLLQDLERMGTREDRFDEACRRGLSGQMGSRATAAWARDLVACAQRGLSRYQPQSAHLLDGIAQTAEAGRSPAEDLLAAFERDPSPTAIIDAIAY